MNHDELLAKIDTLYNNEGCTAWICEANYKSLRAVVELHKPFMGVSIEQCKECMHLRRESGDPVITYPCPTIQAITNQLL